MNILRPSRRRSGEDHGPDRSWASVLADGSLSAKLVLLVVVPLALTLAVTLPRTGIGLNRLASETSTERSQGEIRIIEEQFHHFEGQLNGSADDIARNPVLLSAVRESDRPIIVTKLLSASIQLGLQHLEVRDSNGVSLGNEHHLGEDLDGRMLGELNALGLAELETTRIFSTPEGLLLTAVRTLKDSAGFLGSISVGKLIDVDAPSELNFGRSDLILSLVGKDGEVAFASYSTSDTAKQPPMTLDPELVEAARSGRIGVGPATVDGEEQRAAQAPLELGSGSDAVLAVVLTTSQVVGLRDQLIANHVMVTAESAFLVLGVGYVVTRTITRRILRLRDGAIQIANGNLLVRVEETSHDEMGTFATSSTGWPINSTKRR